VATATTFIVAGSAHPYDGGIGPAATLTLWEGDRARWRLQDHTGQRWDATWDPSAPEDVLAVALVALATVVVGDEAVTTLLGERGVGDWRGEHVEVEVRPGDPLLVAAKDAVGRMKLVVTVLSESVVLDQLGVLEDLESDVELCTPTFWRRTEGPDALRTTGGSIPT